MPTLPVETRKTKVFKSGNSQAIRIPKDFQLDADEVEITRRGDELVIRVPSSNLARAFDLLATMPDDVFPDGRDQPDFEAREKL